MGKARQKHTDAFEAEAAGLATASGRPIAEIARDLGVHDGALGNWMNMAAKRGEIKDKPLTIDERPG
jgi:transposase-like protein